MITEPSVAVRGRRIQLELTQTQLAALADVTTTTIRNIETGRVGTDRKPRAWAQIEAVLGWESGSWKALTDADPWSQVIEKDAESWREHLRRLLAQDVDSGPETAEVESTVTENNPGVVVTGPGNNQVLAAETKYPLGTDRGVRIVTMALLEATHEPLSLDELEQVMDQMRAQTQAKPSVTFGGKDHSDEPPF